MNKEYFAGRRMIIATMHGKEKVIAPVLEEKLGVISFLPDLLDTDQFGTFSGEIERTDDPLETARKKCLKACALHNCTLAVASEGSFGPHPAMFFVPSDDEILVMIDLENNLEVKARVCSANTNFAGRQLSSWQEVQEFAKAVRFPSHGLIVRKEKDGLKKITKGICNWISLEKAADYLLKKYGQVFIETDMRAMYNPTRMKVIEEVTHKLAETAKRRCPSCKTPGFDYVRAIEGLPCRLCGAPTRTTRSLVYCCQICAYHEEHVHPEGKTHEDPTYCDVCNP